MPTFTEDVVIMGPDGKPRIRLNSSAAMPLTGFPPHPGPQQTQTILLQEGRIWAGGGGEAGSLSLQDAAGNALFLRATVEPGQLGTNDVSLVMWSPLHTAESLTLNGRGQIVAGGGQVDGSLRLRSRQGADRILLDASQANVWFGGNGADGDLVLFPSSATNITDATQGSIHLDGQTGDVILQNADCAEDFDVSPSCPVEPGTVMVIDQDGMLRPSQEAYDRRVAGVISGALDCRPGITLGKKPSEHKRLPLALVGKVFCKVDAQYGPIDMGDLLTTSPTAGHAMKADDPLKAFGTVIGKALRPFKAGTGLIPILVALQ